MTLQFVEGDLLFEFGDSWSPILPWDRHPAYEQGIKRIDGGRAMDVLGLHDRTLYLIEVKDYRGRERTKPIHPWNELESKVRNTVAGLTGACRHDEHVQTCLPFVDWIRNRRNRLQVVYWCETSHRPGTPEQTKINRAKVGSLFAGRSATVHMTWLNARVLSTSTLTEYEQAIRDLKVTPLPPRRREAGDEILKLLADRGIRVPHDIHRRIQDCLDVKQLEGWLQRAPHVTSAAELFKQ